MATGFPVAILFESTHPMTSPSTEVPGDRTEPRLAIPRLAIYLTALTPLIVLPGFFFPFVTLRNVFFRLAIELALGMTLWLGIDRLPALRRQKAPILKWFAGFVVAISLAGIFGVSPWHSMFGDFERMGGVLAWLHLLAFYVLLRVLMTEDAWTVFFRASIVVADLIVLWGAGSFAVPLLGKMSFTMGLSAGSTVGNPGLLGPYLLFVAGFATYLLLTGSSRAWKAFYALSLCIAGAGLIGSANRSALLGLLVGLIAAGWLLLWKAERHRQANMIVALLLFVGSVVVLGGRYVGRTYTGHNAILAKWSVTLNPRANAPRTIEWAAAARGFLDRPVLGYGPENHQVIASVHFDPQLYSFFDGGGIFDRPHNAWLEILSTSGLVGIIAMLGLWYVALTTIKCGIRDGQIAPKAGAVWFGLMAGYAVYLSFWFFDLNSTMLWVVVLAAISNSIYGRLDIFSLPSADYRGRKLLLISMESILVLAVVLQGLIPLKAAYDLDTAVGPSGGIEPRLDAYYRVMNSSSPQTAHTTELYTRFLVQLAPLFLQARNDPYRYPQLDFALKRGFLEAKRNIRRDPENPRAYVEQARLSTLAMAFYGNRAYGRGAEKTLAHAVKLSPRHAEYRVLLARVLATLGDTSRAIAQLDTARNYAPTYGATYFQLAKLADGHGDTEAARVRLTQAIERGYPGAASFSSRVATALEKQQSYGLASKLELAYVEAKFGRLESLRVRSDAWTTDEKTLIGHLPIAFLKAGDANSALRAAHAVAVNFRDARPAVRDFVDDVTKGNHAKWINRETLFPAR